MRPLVQLSLAFAAVALGACADEPPPIVKAPPPAAFTAAPPVDGPHESPDAPFRAQAPAPGSDIIFVPPQIQEAKLSNGVRVLVVERHELPIVAVRVASLHGAEDGPVGVGSFTGALLTAGTKTRSAVQLSDAFDALGAEVGPMADSDSLGVAMKVLAPKLHDALGLLADVVQSSTFPKDEVERERSRRLNEIGRGRDMPVRILVDTQLSLLYPANHPYGQPLIGTAEAVEKIGSADLAKFYGSVFQPDSVVIAVAGDVTKQGVVDELERAFGGWKGKAKKGKPIPEPKFDAKGPRIVVVDRPGSTQSNVSVTDVGVPRLSKDHDALMLLNAILGGQFSSRINLNLREKHAYTYGARSNFDMRHGAGPFSVGGAIKTESTAAAIREIFEEVESIRLKPVTPTELSDAKSYLIKQLPARFETAGATAGTLAGLAIYGLPLDEISTLTARLDKVTGEDVEKAAEARLKTDQMRIVIVGDAAKIKDSLAELHRGDVVVKPLPSKMVEKPAKGGKKGVKP